MRSKKQLWGRGMVSVRVLTSASERLLWLLGEDLSEGRGVWRNRHRLGERGVILGKGDLDK